MSSRRDDSEAAANRPLVRSESGDPFSLPFSLSEAVWLHWCRTLAQTWADPKMELCRLLEQRGVWAAAWRIATLWTGTALTLFQHHGDSRVRLAEDADPWAVVNGYEVVPPAAWRRLATGHHAR
jgi:hypothetical protein